MNIYTYKQIFIYYMTGSEKKCFNVITNNLTKT